MIGAFAKSTLGQSARQPRSKPAPRRRANLAKQFDALEDRLLCSANVGVHSMLASAQGFSVSGVGFRNFTIAGLNAATDGLGHYDSNPSHYKASIDWGDRRNVDTVGAVSFVQSEWDKPGHGMPFAVKGSHIYYTDTPTVGQQFPVTITVDYTGPITLPVPHEQIHLGDISVYWMHYSYKDTSSTTHSRQGIQPEPVGGVQPPGFVQIDATKVNSASPNTFATAIDRPVANELLGWINPSYNKQPDVVKSHYKVKINWGDSSQWEEGWVENIPGNNVRLEVRGTKQHAYCIPGVYQVWAYITGPDNTSYAYQMGSANVSAAGVNHLGASVSNLDLNERILHFLDEHLREQLGDGECTNAAIEAIRAAGGRFDLREPSSDGNYVWGIPVVSLSDGRVVSGITRDVRPGDIVQYWDRLSDANGDPIIDHHTAIVAEVDPRTHLPARVYEQNKDYQLLDGTWTDNDRRLHLNDRSADFDGASTDRFGGQITIYRPQALTDDWRTRGYQFTVVNHRAGPATYEAVWVDPVTGTLSTALEPGQLTGRGIQGALHDNTLSVVDARTGIAYPGLTPYLRIQGDNDPAHRVMIEDGAAYEINDAGIHKLDGCCDEQPVRDLTFWGTAGDDLIRLAFDGALALFTLNGQTTRTPFQPGAITSILGGGGNDRIEVDPTSSAGKQVDLYGQTGNDQLLGGVDYGRLVGGPDNDYLAGAAGNSLLLGGPGHDIVRGGTADDADAADRTQFLVTGPDAGGGPHVVVFDPTTSRPRFSFFAYESTFTGGVRVATGDINGDGVEDIITAPGPGRESQIEVFDGVTGQPLSGPLGSFLAYHSAFRGGVFVASGDLNGDGRDDIVIGADAGGGPHLRALSGRDGSELLSFFAYASDFRGGVRVATGDVNGDGRMDLITATGPGGGPHVRVFNGASGTQLPGSIGSFFAYASTFTGGIYPAAGDLNGDGRDDVITGAGAGGGPHVRAFNSVNGAQLAGFFAYAPTFTGGIRVASADVDGDGRDDIITGAGPNGGPHVRARSGATLADLTSYFAYSPAFTGGIYVAGARFPAHHDLRLAGGAAAAESANAVSADQLEVIRAAALERWDTADADSSLDGLVLEIVDLPDNLLGLALGDRILIDRDAAGRGWFIDPTPNADEEFDAAGQALARSAIDHVDLLTVVLHELGHSLGLGHDPSSPGSLMQAELPISTRRTPRSC